MVCACGPSCIHAAESRNEITRSGGYDRRTIPVRINYHLLSLKSNSRYFPSPSEHACLP